MVKTIGIIVQAHMGSTRLPKKMMKNLCGKSVLAHIIDRLKRSSEADKLLIATSDLPADDVLVDECKRCGVDYFRGSDSDVLERFYQAAQAYGFDHIARVCADNTLVDWNIIDHEIKMYRTGSYDVVAGGKSVPLGLGCEVFSWDLLKEAHDKATEHYQHEHVTPYLYEHYSNVGRYELAEDLSRFRFTLDTEQDWQLINKIYGELYRGVNDFLLDDVVRVMNAHPAWFDINKNVKQKKVKEA